MKYLSRLKVFSIKNKIELIRVFFISSILLINYLTFIKYLSIIYIFFINKFRSNLNDKLILSSVLILFLINIIFLSNPLIDTVKIIRYFFGFYFFYFIFKNFNKVFISLKTILYISVAAIIFEFILFNFFGDYFQIIQDGRYLNKIFFNFDFDKPLGLGLNSTVSAIMIILLIYNMKMNIIESLLILLTILLLNSGLGYCLYFLYLIVKLYKNNNIKILLLIIFTFLIIINFGLIEKIHKNIFTIYFNLKVDLIIHSLINYFDIRTFITSNLVEYVYLDPEKGKLSYGGEIPHIYYFLKVGLLGLFVLIFLIREINNNCSFLFFIFIFVGLLHYPFICNFYGQLIFAYLIYYRSLNKLYKT